eukprot:COSAG05_NODE_9481_length_621_cov_1.651341_2_plen_47_part_01
MTGAHRNMYSSELMCGAVQVVLACHWLLECAIHTWPESQRRGLTILV